MALLLLFFRGNTRGLSSKWLLPQSLSSLWRNSGATQLGRCQWQTTGRFLRWTRRSPARGDALLLCGRAPLSVCTASAHQSPPWGSHEWRRRTTPTEMRKISYLRNTEIDSLGRGHTEEGRADIRKHWIRIFKEMHFNLWQEKSGNISLCCGINL